MAYLKILSICVLVTAVASGDCFFSNLMNEPLNFAVSLLDGQGKSRPAPRTTPDPYPSTTVSSREVSTQIFSTPDRDVTMEVERDHAKQHNVMAKKFNMNRNNFKSKKPKMPKVDAFRVSSDVSSWSSAPEGSGFASSSEEFVHIPGKSQNRWKNSREYKHMIARPKKAGNQRLMASISNKRGHSDHVNAIVHASPLKAGRNIKQSGWKKNIWLANRSVGSAEKLPTVKAMVEPHNKIASGSSEEYIIITKSGKPSWRTSKFRSNILGYSNRGAARFVNKRRFPAIKPTRLCGVCP